ncbi:sigma-70 family RNA polymerase sigma factor [Rhodopirellula sp. JC740]|uniref:Sigma-70 family RNA polymerase sigma factor n=1 Tax=Rhodopirellula halodulae TaxID=2894198 RepID=A0ABS8NJ63_9BACT|nr:sigma-70 family RNA polymerase sigma factor [Rhodopirellula sp. JC740]MCC9643589.1 sigma-70 family RNA polymerase sigma factor [Rhodopirellula sp. JC740]
MADSPATIEDDEMVALIAKHQPMLRAVIRSMVPGYVPGHSDGDDVLQETNMVLWQKRETFAPGTSFPAWAATVARLQVMAWRKRSATHRAMTLDDDALIDEIASRAADLADDMDQRREALQHCLAGLTDEQRELVQQRYFSKDSLVDFAAQRGLTYPTLKKTLERVRTRLRKCVRLRLAAEASS